MKSKFLTSKIAAGSPSKITESSTAKIPIVAVVGPTATGKSDLAVALAKKFKGEIISADFRQVYIGLDLGSGKITTKEMRVSPIICWMLSPPALFIMPLNLRKPPRRLLKTFIAAGNCLLL